MSVLSFGVSVVKPVNAQTIPTPSVPQFTVKFVNASYSFATTNPYTGESQTQQVSNDYIVITIKNQPFAYSNNGLIYQEYFNVRVKPHFTGNWIEIYPLENGTSTYNGNGSFSYAEYVSPDSPIQSDSKDTSANFYVIPTEFHLQSGSDFQGYEIQRYYSAVEGLGSNETFLSEVPNGGQLDFQVQALVGHNSTMWYNRSPFYAGVGWYVSAVAYDSAGNWSPTQTVTIGQSSTSPTPTVPEFPSLLVILSIFIVVLLSIAVLVRVRKSKIIKSSGRASEKL
jgi:hypothetical protein